MSISERAWGEVSSQSSNWDTSPHGKSDPTGFSGYTGMRQAKGWATDWMKTYVLEIMKRHTITNLFFTRDELQCKPKVINKKHSVGKGEGGRAEADTHVCEFRCHHETEKTQAAVRKGGRLSLI